MSALRSRCDAAAKTHRLPRHATQRDPIPAALQDIFDINVLDVNSGTVPYDVNSGTVPYRRKLGDCPLQTQVHTNSGTDPEFVS